MDILNNIWADVMEKPANLVVPMALFYLLAPGNFTVQTGVGMVTEMVGFPLSVQQDALMTHALILGLSLAVLRDQFPEQY